MRIEPCRAGKSEPAKEFAERIKEIHKEAGAALSKARDDMTRYADQHRGTAPKYKVGDKVSTLHSPTYSGRIPVSPTGISGIHGIQLTFFYIYFTLY